MIKDELISTDEAASILGITRQSVGWLLRHGRIEGQKIADRWVVEKASVLDYKQERETREKNADN